jgi:hypothetical protein
MGESDSKNERKERNKSKQRVRRKLEENNKWSCIKGYIFTTNLISQYDDETKKRSQEYTKRDERSNFKDKKMR